MQTTQYITIRTARSNRRVDLEVPADEPIRAFLPDLIKVINWPEFLEGASVSYQLCSEDGQALDQGKSLADLGLNNFEMVWISMQADAGRSAPAAAAPQEHADETGQRALPEPPFRADIPIDSPALVSAQGLLFVLGQPPLTIGRASRDFKPSVDLGELDDQLLSSRRHAEILHEGGAYLLRALPTTNGTFINNSELPPGEKRVLKNGDIILFGFRGVELTFRAP